MQEKTSELFMRILALILVFFLGYFSCIGSLVGAGYILYSKISIDNLKGWGLLSVDTDEYVDATAPAPLTSMTLELMMKELSALRYVTDSITLDYMIDRYGLILPESVDALLPKEVRELKINELVGENGKDALLNGITVKSLLSFVPEGTISEPAAAVLGERTLREVMDADMGYLLTGVHLGYLVGVNYTKDEAGNFIVVLADPEHPTMFELIAPVDVGELLSVLSEGGDMMGVFRKSIGNVMLLTLLETMMGAPSDMIASIMEGKTLEDVLVLDEQTGAYTLKIDALLDGQMIGDLLGYTPVWSETEPPFVLEWQQDGAPVTGYMRGLASVDAGVITEEGFEPSALFADVYLGDFMNYTPVIDAQTGEVVDWTDASGAPINKAYRTLAMKSVEEMTSEGMQFDTMFEGICVGDFYGYVYDEEREVWTEEVSEGVYEDVSGMNRAIANIEIGKLLSDGDYDIADEFEGMQLGELLGYTKDGENWYQEVDDGNGGTTLEKVGAMESAIADTDAGDLMNGEFDIAETFDGMQLGELLGYTKDGDDWYQEVDDGNGGTTLEKVGAMESAIADADAGELMSGEFDIAETYKDVFVGDMMEYTRGEEILPEGGESAELPQDRQYEWLSPETNEPITGMEAKLANYSLYKLIKGEEKMDADSVTEGMTVAELLGLTQKECYVYDEAGNPILVGGERVTVSLWYDDEGSKVSGVISAMANKEFSDMVEEGAGFDSIYIGEVIGQAKIGEDEKWYTLSEVTTHTDGEYEEYRVTATLATGLMSNLSDLTVGDMSNNSKVTDKIQGIKVGEAMGWTKVGDTWYTTYDAVSGTGEEATGTMAALADYPIGDLNTEIEQMPIGELLGYKKVGDTWYDGDEPLDGVMKAIAGIAVQDLSTELDGMPVGELLGYEKIGDTWYDGNEPLDGVMKVIADTPLNQLSGKINEITIGEIMGWTAVTVGEGESESVVWYEVYDEEHPENNKEATGIMAAFADLTLDEMSDGAKVSEVVRTVKVGDAMGWTLHEGVWYKTFVDENDPANEKADGTLGALADYPIGDINAEIKNLEVGKLLGWTQDGDDWVDEDKNTVDGLMGIVAGYKVNELSTKIDEIKIGDIMGWDYDEENETWSDNGNEPTGIMAGFADLTMDDMRDPAKVSAVVQDLKLGDALGWTKIEDTWYKSTDPMEKATGTMAALADYKVSEIDTHIMELSVGEAMGWRAEPIPGEFYEDGAQKNKWYKEVTVIDQQTGELVVEEVRVTGFMGVIADHPITEIEDEIHNEKAGTMLDYEYMAREDNGEMWWHKVEYDEQSNPIYTPVSKLTNTVCNKQIDEMGTAMNDMSIGDVYDYTPQQDAALEQKIPGWKEYGITDFCDMVILIMTGVPRTNP